MRGRGLLVMVPPAAALFAAGCCPKALPPRGAHFGPTEGLPALVEKLNAKNERIVSLRCEGGFSADLIDPKTGKHTGGDGDLTLLYTPPGNLRLSAKVLTEKVFDAGSDEQTYWLSLPREDVVYVGTRRAAAEGRAAKLAVRPDLLAQVLGVTPLDPDLLKEPVPTLRFDNEQDCYVVTYAARQADHWATQKETWYDRQTLQPVRVTLFDDRGRAVLRAAVSRPEPVDGYDPPVSVPGRYDLVFPDTGSTFSIRLSTLEKSRNNAPNSRTFAVPAVRPGVRTEPLDR